MKELNALESLAKISAENWEPLTPAGTKEILAIAEAFRALEQERDELRQRAEAAEEIVSDVNEVIALLSEREWAENCTKTETGKQLEELITGLHDDIVPAINIMGLAPTMNGDSIPGKNDSYIDMCDGWDACLAAMLSNIEGKSK